MATIIEILETDRLVDSRADLNSNFTALNTAKVDGATALTTAGRLVEVASSGVATQTSFASSVVVLTSGSYADPAWVTSLATSKLSGTVADTNLASTAVTPAAYGAAASVATFTVDAKGRLTAAANVAIAIAASQVTSGAFADALVAASNVTQHQAALSLATSQITGTKAGATFLSDYATAFVNSLTGTANQITVSAAAGAITISIPTNPTLPGTTTGTFSGNLTGNVTGNASGTAATITGALALANTPLTTRGDLLVATTATPILGRLAKGTQYQVLLGGATDPTWGAVDLAQASAITGLLPLGNGGTGATTLAGAGIVAGSASITTANALLIGASAGTLGQSDATFVSGVLTRAGTVGLSATGANVVTVSTNGSTRWSVLSGGNLQGTGRLLSSGGLSEFPATGSYVGLYYNSGGYGSLYAYNYDAASVKLVLQEYGSNVLIGTTTDDGSSKLQVAGTATLDPGAAPLLSALRVSANSVVGISAFVYATDNSAIGFDVDYSSGFKARNATGALLYKNSGTLLFQGSGGNTPGAAFTQNNIIALSLASGNTLVGGNNDGQYRLDVQSSGSAGTARFFDQTDTTGVTSAVIRAGAGQGSAALLTVQNNAGTARGDWKETNLAIGRGVSTETVTLQIAPGRTGDGFSILDLIGDATNTAFGLRLIRSSGGVNSDSYLSNVGTGVLYVQSANAGAVEININTNARFRANNTGIGFFGVTPVARAAALTAAEAGALNTGDAGSDTVIGNMRTRIGELETKLQAYGLLN